MPSSLGIFRSVTTTSNRAAASFSTASSPSAAVTTSCPCVARSSASVTRLIFSSSAMRIFIFRLCQPLDGQAFYTAPCQTARHLGGRNHRP